jgi:adenine deaminase
MHGFKSITLFRRHHEAISDLVIPSLKISDRGLFDVDAFALL